MEAQDASRPAPGAPAAQRSVAGDRETLLRILAAVTFLIFFQGFMLAPLIPRLSTVFGVSERVMGLVVPAYMVPYAIATLVYGLLSDRVGRRRVLLGSLAAFVVLTGLTATATTAEQLTYWRVLTGLGASGVIPIALTVMGDLFPYEQRGRPLGWLFGAMAGGMAFGASVGVVLEAFVGWRWLFLGVAVLAALTFALLLSRASLLPGRGDAPPRSAREVLAGFRELLTTGRGARTYAYVLWNGAFHAGVFTWLGFYFASLYGLSEWSIGLALLGYGIPGFALGPTIGRAADRWGRRWLVPAGLLTAALAAAVLIPTPHVVVASLAVTALSLGYDMTQPLFAGIVTQLGGKRRGQAMGLNVFALFLGMGVGSVLFSLSLTWGFPTALLVFALVQALAAALAIPAFRSETRSSQSA